MCRFTTHAAQRLDSVVKETVFYPIQLKICLT